MPKRVIYYLLIPFLSFSLYCSSGTELEIETFTVKKGDFLYSVTETGELEAVNSITISAPRLSWRFGGVKVTNIVEDGSQVQEGDLICQFDKTEVLKALDDARAELEIADAELRKARANNESRIQELEANLEETQLQYEISKLNLEKATYEPEIRKKEIQLELDKAAISLEKAKQEIENQKSINQEGINKLELTRHQVETKLLEAQETIDKLNIYAPSPGIVIIERNRTTDEKYQINDQVWSGHPFITLPDLGLMQAKVPINEVDIAKIDTLQEAHIRMDAFPDSVFIGHVTDVATLARNKDRNSKVKVFDVYVQLDETNKNLMPGMTVSSEIIISKIPDTIYIPIEALFSAEGNYVVYLKSGNSFKKQPVKIGDENDDFVIIQEGLNEGDKVALVDPEFLLKEKKESEKTAGEES
ncbi:efflux RND transporter periplasmic adaptor subunit [candidate division KSB1 bacterium]|nr:efflux RND transporter periplasmic adaptor subunit [candidate division KSB1 bacterium]